MKLTRKGFPNSGEVTGWIPDRRGNLRPVHVVQDGFGRTVIFDLGKPINRLPPEETFLRDPKVARFGRKGIREELERQAKIRALRKLGANLHPVLRAADAAYDAYELWQELQPGEPLPRDPEVPEDVEITFPTEGWNHQPVTWESPNFVYDHLTGVPHWAKNTPDANGGYGSLPDSIAYRPDTVEEWWADQPTYFDPVPAIDIPNTSFNVGDAVQRWEEFNNPNHPITSRKVGDAQTDTWTKEDADAPNPDYANPPRLGPPTVVVRVLPREGVAEEPEPYRRANEADNPWLFEDQSERGEPKRPQREPGFIPVPVPPPIIVDPIPLPKPGEEPMPGQQPKPVPEAGDYPLPYPQPVKPGQDKPRRQPSEGVKERKAKIKYKGIVLAIRGAVGVTTEMLDIINAAWNALPKHCRPGYYPLKYRDKATGQIKTYYKRRWRADFNQRHAAVWKCAAEMDIEKFLFGVIAQNQQDKMWAKLGQASGRAGRAAGRDTGWQFGEWDTIASEMAQEASQSERIAAERAKRDIELAEKEFRKWVKQG